MGITKTDFMRGMQCPRMLWLDAHRPELRVIPPFVRASLQRGNDFGDSLMGIFGPFEEVKEYYPGTTIPNKWAMARRTQELISQGTGVICEAAFMDRQGNYCAADILRRDEERGCYDLYEIKISRVFSDQFVKDAGYQAHLIHSTGLPLDKVFIIFHGQEPYEIREVTVEANRCAAWVVENIGRLNVVREQMDEYACATGSQCERPYKCWYYSHCHLEGEEKP